MFSFVEIVDALVMVIVVAYIFSDIIPSQGRRHNSISLNAVLAVAPGIILHEFAHKIVAIILGFKAVFSASYVFLMVGALLKFVNAGFIFFVPGYVSINCAGGACITGIETAMIAFSGPAINGILYLWARWYETKIKNGNWLMLIRVTKKLNGFLFIFNMLPVPLFDGWKVYAGLWAWISGIL